MANFDQRLEALERQLKPKNITPIINKRPKLTRDEWVELQTKTEFKTAAYPILLREILTRRGDNSEILHREYIERIENEYAE